MIPLATQFTSPYAYYVLTPNLPPSKQSERPLKVQAFIDWLLEIFAPYRHQSDDLS